MDREAEKLAAALEGVEVAANTPPKILAARFREDGVLVVVVDLGIRGCPKHFYSPEEIAAHGNPVLRTLRGTFTSPKVQDADGKPELIAKRTKTKKTQGN